MHHKTCVFLTMPNYVNIIFGAPRNKGTSHHVYKTPWIGDPRVNVQLGKNGKAKSYQVKQVLEAVKRIKEQNDE